VVVLSPMPLKDGRYPMAINGSRPASAMTAQSFNARWLLCRKRKARLVIAKLDRLSRNLAFIAALMDSGVEFVAVDNPHATCLTLHILAAVPEHERAPREPRPRSPRQKLVALSSAEMALIGWLQPIGPKPSSALGSLRLSWPN